MPEVPFQVPGLIRTLVSARQLRGLQLQDANQANPSRELNQVLPVTEGQSASPAGKLVCDLDYIFLALVSGHVGLQVNFGRAG